MVVESEKLAHVLPLLLAGALAPAPGCSRAPRLEIGAPEAQLSRALVGTCSVFLRIANAGNGTDALIGASVDVPGTITEMHEVREGKMVRRDRLAIPARGSLELRPGGPHIMVFHLPADAGAGRELTLRLVFETSGERLTQVRIQGQE